MPNLLDKIIEETKSRVAERRRKRSVIEVKQQILDAPKIRSLYEALRAKDISVIGEHKRKSPSAGEMQPANIDRAYEAYSSTEWISAISVVTNVDRFGGDILDLRTARKQCGDKPILRKDFVLDEYQVYEARANEADAILLMAALHVKDPAKLNGLFDLARDLGMDVLVEFGLAGSDPNYRPELLAAIVPDRARIWGINSRNFRPSFFTAALPLASRIAQRDVTIDLDRHKDLRHLVPAGKMVVAESGIASADDLVETREAGFNAALIGTAFLKGPRSIEDVIEALGAAFEPASRAARARIPLRRATV